MDVHIVVGWNDEDAFDSLDKLGATAITSAWPVNTQTIDDDFNTYEFSVTDIGIKHINEKLLVINNMFGTSLEWRLYPGNNFVLVWRDELMQSIGDPNDNPVGKFLIDHNPGYKWKEFEKKFKLSTPVVITILDAEVFYYRYIETNDDACNDDE